MLPLPSHLHKLFGVLCFILLFATVSHAQSKTESVAGLAQQEKPTLSKPYYYPNFKKGKITFISGTASSGVINYNVLNEEIEFIVAKKDTLAFNDMYLIDMITVENDTFYYDNRNAHILKLLERVNDRKLLVKDNTQTETKAYFISHKADYLPATKPNLLKLFPAHEASLQSYMQSHNLQLQSEKEIKQVLEYASGL